jgi:hypothetical protein
LVELLVVVVILAVLIALLLPAVQSARKAALQSRLASQTRYDLESRTAAAGQAGTTTEPAVRPPSALVRSFTADVTLTPRLSVGTAAPESIYEARFIGQIEAVRPREDAGDCEIELPLPPQIISLADLSIKAAGEPSERVVLRSGKLVWRGALPAEPTPLESLSVLPPIRQLRPAHKNDPASSRRDPGDVADRLAGLEPRVRLCYNAAPMDLHEAAPRADRPAIRTRPRHPGLRF